MNLILIILLFSTLLGCFAGKFLSDILYKFQKRVIRNTFLKNYHIHHSFAGLIIVLLGIFIPFASIKLVFLGIGIGMFLQHTFSEGFVFISKDKI